MGSSPSKTYLQQASAPTAIKSVIPKEHLKASADYLNRLRDQTQVAQEQLYAQSGTPAELGAKQAQANYQSAATYLSSLPKGDKYSADTYSAARDTAGEIMSDAQKKYADALLKAKTTNPPPAYSDTGSTPSWVS